MGKTWLITGSSRGFGWELAKASLSVGDNVVATARRPEQLAELVEQYRDQVRAVALDVTCAEQAQVAVRTALEEFGHLDVVVNNAGYANSAPIEHTTDEDLRAQFEANFFGVVNVTKAAIPIFREQGSGYFLQFSSVGGRVGGTPGIAAYQAAKFAVEGFSEVLANELRPFGVRVTIIEPGAFRTDWQGSSMIRPAVRPEYDSTVGQINRMREATDGKQPGDPVRAAKIIVDLAASRNPPLRLVLGAAALESVKKSSEARALEAAQWADISRSADFPDA